MERKFRKRSSGDYLKLSRGWAANHYRTEETKIDPHHAAGNFIEKGFGQALRWAYHTFKSRFGKKYPYPVYPQSGDKGVYNLSSVPDNGQPVVIALAADWATDTFESDTIAEQMQSHHPDFTIHLGDTYFVGTPDEINNNFLSPGASWPRGKHGSFALLGNHEMYARGVAFFRDLLPAIGFRGADGRFLGQKAGYFCLENEHWRIIGLDTGYNSIGKIPILDLLPFFSPNCRFEGSLVLWLKETLHLGDKNDKRGIVVLTHHQYITAFKNESEYQLPANQLSALLGSDRKIIWIWGHEHKFSMYGKARVQNGVTAYGRCIGHGGMPVELGTFKLDSSKKGAPALVMYDSRPRPGSGEYPQGYNGFVLFKLLGKELQIEYYDINGYLLSESWKVGNDGEIEGEIKVPATCPLSPVPGKTWSGAVNG